MELQIRDTTLSFKQFTDSADILINQTLPQVPLDTYATSPTTTVGVQFPAPRDIFLPKPLPGRCSANTLAGTRCRGECFAPFTLCSTHWRYFRAHRFLPPGGAPEPGMPHPDDVWMHAPSDRLCDNRFGFRGAIRPLVWFFRQTNLFVLNLVDHNFPKGRIFVAMLFYLKFNLSLWLLNIPGWEK